MRLKDRNPELLRKYVREIQALMAAVGVAGVVEIVEEASKDLAVRSSKVQHFSDIEMWSKIAACLFECRFRVVEAVESKAGYSRTPCCAGPDEVRCSPSFLLIEAEVAALADRIDELTLDAKDLAQKLTGEDVHVFLDSENCLSVELVATEEK